MDNSPNLQFPYIMPAQAQKHVTHNEALRGLDTIVQLAVIDETNDPAATNPENGQRYLVGPMPLGLWTSQSGNIAAWQDNAWTFFTPNDGWLCWVQSNQHFLVFSNSKWQAIENDTSQNNGSFQTLGINATASDAQRIAISSETSLFNHSGADHRLQINKSDTQSTASILFQENFISQAEFGLTGQNDFSIKTLSNGTDLVEAMRVDQMGNIGIGKTPEFRLDINANANSGWPARLSGNFAQVTTRNALFFERKAGGAPLAAGTILGGLSFGGDNGVNLTRGFDGGAEILAATFENWEENKHGTNLLFYATTPGQRYPGPTLAITGFSVLPGVDNGFSLGGNGARWSSVWSATGVIQTSDQRDKTNIKTFDKSKASKLVDRIQPILFKWQSGANQQLINPEDKNIDDVADIEKNTQNLSKPGKRLHAGFLAQEVKNALHDLELDFGVWGMENKDDTDSRQWLRPDQMIPVLWAALQQTREELRRLQKRKS